MDTCFGQDMTLAACGSESELIKFMRNREANKKTNTYSKVNKDK